MKKTPNEVMPNFNKKIEADSILFFDMDGTLVDTSFANYLSYKAAIQKVTESEFNIPYSPVERFNRGVLKQVIPSLTKSQYEIIIQQKEEHYKEYLPETKLNRAVADILLRYTKTNRIVLVTNSRRDRAFMTLHYHGIADKFSHIFYRQTKDGETSVNKYSNAILNLNISADAVIVFENEKLEIDNAIVAGIPSENIIKL